MPIRDIDPEEQARVQALVRALQQLGWSDGHNVKIDLRSAGGSAERSREIAAEFVALGPGRNHLSGSVATAAIMRADLIDPRGVRGGERTGRGKASSQAWRGPAATPPASP